MDTQKNVLTVPIAIIVAGIIIGGAIFLSRVGPTKEIFSKQVEQALTDFTTAILLRPVSESDHVLGNPEASIVLVEYSDLECPFCKSFHKTMQTLLDQYGKDGKIAWVYRHFPLEIHPRAQKEAEASECAFDLGGNEKFWTYVSKLFEITPSNNGLAPENLPKIAKQIGLDEEKFQSCLVSGKNADKIKADYDDGLRAGVNGTPHTILILSSDAPDTAIKKLGEINQSILAQMPPGSKNPITFDSGKRKIGISGAFQFSLMKEIVDLLLR